ncbi:MAG: arsenate reductase (glutaredoxin) [Flavobacteriales bacterium]|nr:arsenate reductase (glutaredoxin) [Flavobacteriales bacterium]|tara:strand:- start:1226 stop:1570 length:345 start_codon:yes stop_codon:yes gene_type:complete
MKIYHNPRCRKSRETLSIIKSHHYEVEIIEYLKNPINKSELKNLISMLNISPFDLIRKEDKLFKQKYKHKNLTEEECLDLLCMHPLLIQRPIVVKDNSAILGRPPINVLDLFNK